MTEKKRYDDVYGIGLPEENETDRKIREHGEYLLAQDEQRKEQRRREAARAELEEYLRQRGQRYQDVTGETPTRAQLARWRDEYADEREAELRAEREQQRQNFDRIY